MTKRISIWGATGSIGEQTLDVISRFMDRFEIVALTAHSRVDLLLEQAKRFRPDRVVITGNVAEATWESQFGSYDVDVLWGKDGLLEIAGNAEEDLVVNALVGSVGLEATMKALEAGTSIALANKEVLVMAGEIVMREAEKRGLSIIPIDSEHSAVFQCLVGEHHRDIDKIILTASGGPFLKRTMDELADVSVEEALAHPNWSMGKKVTIDSATMMNKGLEVIEARWLFDMNPDSIRVVIHPQSIIHSMVEFADGSIKAQLGVPDMRIPISYALTCPERWPGDYGRMDFLRKHELLFLPPDLERFRCLKLAYDVLNTGGVAPAVLNGADEAAVKYFLHGRIGFLDIPKIIEESLQRHPAVSEPCLEDVLEADRWSKEFVDDFISRV